VKQSATHAAIHFDRIEIIIASIGSPVSAVKEEPANVAIQVRYRY